MNKLAEVERKLPTVWKKTGVPQLALVVMVLVGLFGIGGAKLSAYANSTMAGFATGQYSITADMNQRISAAANVITIAKKIPNLDKTLLEQAQQAVDAAENLSSPAQAYQNNQAMETAIEALYNTALTQADAQQKDQLSEQHSEFLSRGTILRNSAYNEQAKAFNDKRNAFPANLIGALWGVQEAEYFA